MKFSKIIFKVVLWLALISVLPVAWMNANALQDWAKLLKYKPEASVSALASQDQLTDYGKRLFYINRPKVETSVASFRADCSEAEQTIVLGCYHAGQNGISLYDVKDPRLQGILQVTAAHEMLHGAYERLSQKDRNYVDGLLQDYYSHVTDQRIIDTINAYKKTEPNDVVNEMHSIFGTEILNLPASLDNYYKKYFDNRSVITNYASKYQDEFTARINQINDYDASLASLKSKIDSEEQDLSASLSQINADRSRLDSLKNSGDIADYNSMVPIFNREVDVYNAGVSRLKADIANYNSTVATRNAVADELRSLDSSIDTRLTAQVVQ